ncbi:hypothetical protein CWB41_04565 [Methylovirgula ligni]|uniref:Uncharacterized protein n=1 Tax=Methylovirgula ligni TaxID=569860 RepID=A0A3D9Z3G8_9HYPH|nr:hypothetical protein CWB41_04565 [Methylovirgula ligni]REF89631.1 hypothetical protein DES32_0859 [Methylovirgula ligni]
MPNRPVRASAIALPHHQPAEPTFVPTDAGRAYLLLQDIAAAGLDLPPELAAELAALTGGPANV